MTCGSTPAEYTLEIYRGDSGHWRFQLWADDAKTQPVDLTGVTARSQIRDRPQGSQVFDMSCTVTLPNIVDVMLAAATSHTLPVKGAWDLQLTYASGDVISPVYGPVTVTADVTDST